MTRNDRTHTNSSLATSRRRCVVAKRFPPLVEALRDAIQNNPDLSAASLIEEQLNTYDELYNAIADSGVTTLELVAAVREALTEAAAYDGDAADLPEYIFESALTSVLLQQVADLLPSTRRPRR
jgi:hypothetical protein